MSREKKYTPGPWKVKSPTNSGHVDVEGANSLTVFITAVKESKIEHVSNAYLGAAAPELLEALEMMMKQFYHKNAQGYALTALNYAEQAIAKAYGEEDVK